ncbi:RidA family protein [Paenibacillus sp. N4]|uniref:RidA family protein n=1 Tax=Paenibacillus vietnamensis TaxID=2590547 RepID=UPI001CD18D08|nr:RidA family protein [Paenibacillus vietnamensis]MCA0757428.1 RidA family protein [Paenibacillus vietnamensis]
MNVRNNIKIIAGTALVSCFIGASVYAGALTPNKLPLTPIHEPEFYGSASSSISSSVAIPEGLATFSTSGTVPPLLNKDGKNVYERYGNTEKQGEGILLNIEKQLKEQGLSMKDVVYLRVYVTPDAAQKGAFDFQGWFNAYAKFFNTNDNPVKPARSTVGVAGLVNPDWLIEIEAVAVYPKGHKQN